MGKIRGRDYISWLWQYTAPYAGRIGLLLLFGLLETFASLAMVQITKEIIDHATVGSGFGRLLTGYVLLLLGMQGISVLSTDRKSTRLNSSHRCTSRMPSSA